jgi:ATP-dependent Clp protease protease subunit
MLARADKKAPLEIYINSPGGSVFAGNEMINAVNAWAKETGQSIDITVGAMAASMAAAMTVNMNAAKVRVHKNSKLMFHGAWTMTEGGADAHKDEAGLLEKINNDIKTTLVSRYKLEPERVDSWFAEGRAGWLSAQEAKEVGIAAEIVDAEDKPQKINKTVSAMLSDRGLKIAAILEPEIVEDTESENGKTEVEARTEESKTDGKGEGGTGTVTGNQGNDVQAVAISSESVSPVAEMQDKIKEQSARLEEFAGSVKSLMVKNEKLVLDCKAWQGRHDKAVVEYEKQVKDFNAEISGLKSQHETEKSQMGTVKADLEARLAKLTLGATALDPEPCITSWQGALDVCNGDYVLARKQYPAIFAAYLKEKQKETQKNRKVK